MTAAHQTKSRSRDESATARFVRALRRPGRLAAGIAGAVAILAGAALTVAPVTLSETTVQWPDGDGATESTVLLLTNQTPYSLDLRFDDAAVTAATDDVLFATMDPERDDARVRGLVIEESGGDLVVGVADRSERVPAAGVSEWTLHSDVDGLSLSADGAQVLDLPQVLPPQVDALITDASGVDSASLSATLQVVDDPNSSPSAVKIALMVVLWLALLFALFALWRDDRDNRVPTPARPAEETERARPWWQRFVVTDAIVIAALTLWVFIGPMTDDDGYYANMALNYGEAGYVGNYFQMYNQPFTPFTWFWQLLWAWQELGGHSPVWLRLPALAAAIVAWFLTRSLLDRLLRGRGARVRGFAHLLLGLVYVAWWSAYTIGTRPEAVGALASVLALALVLRALERRALLPAAFAALAAGLAFAAHPTGGVAFAPVLLAVPALWSIARRGGVGVVGAALRTVAVLSVGSVALFAAFADATLHDMLLSQARFAAVETPLGWQDESARYALLLADIPMGSYAKRAVVLIALVALLWFVILWAAARLRRADALPRALVMVGWSFALTLVLLWVTTSKWTHHFGALSSLGPLLIVGMAIAAPVVVGRLLEGARLPVWLPVLAAASFFPAIVVSLEGPNTWAYSWDQFLYSGRVSPRIGRIELDSPALWIGVLALCLIATALLLRRRSTPWSTAASLYGATALITVFAVISTGFLYATFGNAALRGISSYSPGGANLRDPMGRECLTERAITVWDGSRGTELSPASVTSVLDAVPEEERAPQRPTADMIGNGTLAPDTYPLSDPPPAGAGTTWGSVEEPEAGALETDWFRLPDALAEGEQLTALVGGSAGPDSDNGLIVQIGSLSGDGEVTITRESWVTDAAERPGWRSLLLGIAPSDVGSDAVVRIIGVDGSAAPGDWFGFGAPHLVEGVAMADLEVADEPSLVAWQSNFWFPCSDPITIADGVIEPPAFATTYGETGPDNIWVDRRGGALAGVARIATVNTPASAMEEAGSRWGRVVLFDYPYATDGYRIDKTPITVSGLASPFGKPSQLVEFERIQDESTPEVELVP